MNLKYLVINYWILDGWIGSIGQRALMNNDVWTQGLEIV